MHYTVCYVCIAIPLRLSRWFICFQSLYAFSLVPMKHLAEAELVKQPENCTECPFRYQPVGQQQQKKQVNENNQRQSTHLHPLSTSLSQHVSIQCQLCQPLSVFAGVLCFRRRAEDSFSTIRAAWIETTCER